VAAFSALWIVLVGVGAYQCYAFETTPGLTGLAPASWPADSALVRSTATATLVMFALADCSCTEATLVEVSGVLAELSGPPTTVVLFTGKADPRTSANWRAAARIPGATVRRDDGSEARRFGARTSGQVLVYDEHGVLRFSGGLTGSRGHVGDNVGRSAVLAALQGRDSVATHGVFGCALENE
jgi:hypothetical protein